MVLNLERPTALVVFAHPVSGSFTAAVRDRVVAGLEAGGMVVDELDLYGADFDPCISAGELAGAGEVDPVLGNHIDRLRMARALVFVYPIWWGAQPAIVKGWLDRLWYQPEASDCFRSIRRLVVVSPHGSSMPRNSVQGAPGKRIVFRLLRSRCHVRARRENRQRVRRGR